MTMVIENIKKVMIWVKIFGLVFEFWNPESLSHFASELLCLLYLDTTIEEKLRLEFAKVCIEISVENSILNFIDLLLPNQENIELWV